MAGVTTEFPTSAVLPNTSEYVPLFAQRAGATLERCEEIFNKRGDQYGDTWLHCQWLALKASLFTRYGIKPSIAELRLTALSALIDIKYSRLLGGYNEDHLLDLINYCAAAVSETQEVYKEPSGRIGKGGIEYKQELAGEPIQVRVNGEWMDL